MFSNIYPTPLPRADRLRMYPLNIPPQNEPTTQRPRPGSSAASKSDPKSERAKSSQTRSPQVRQFAPNPTPNWLKSLLTIQRGTLVLFASAIGLSAIVYGYTVHTQDLWKSQYQQLKRLRTQETQQAVMNENLKQQLAISAQKSDSGLVSPTPDRSVFIPSAPLRPLKPITNPQSTPSPLKSKLTAGY
ncbi:hypothetical protein [Chamaesiphon sp. VAR_69_metabat_338]|uniref:hypothetical protein n=1 Tax=Chamaesiphon sp. VAR_69_metabat_338 TaxID=2964704 RepID=UPI00286DFCD7|nr:hypothetical protein [Chamaesiphon sp. VAR_69_metabat_338]